MRLPLLRRLIVRSRRLGPQPRRWCSGDAHSAAEATSPASAGDGGIRDLLGRYQTLMIEAPIRTNAVTSGLLCAIGDGLSQVVEWKMQIMSPDKTGYNYMRTLRMTVYGTCAGPMFAFWYRTLDVTSKAVSVSYQPVLSGKLASLVQHSPAVASAVQRSPLLQWAASLHKEEALSFTPARILAAKVIGDSLLASPLMLHAYFMSIGLLEGRGWTDTVEMTKVNFHRAWGLALVVWTPVQMLNFHFVPVHFQAAFVSMVNVGWKMTLSLISHYHDYGTPHLRMTKDATEAEVRRLQKRCAELETMNEELRRRLKEQSPSLSRDAAWQPKYSPLTQAAAHYAGKGARDTE